MYIHTYYIMYVYIYNTYNTNGGHKASGHRARASARVCKVSKGTYYCQMRPIYIYIIQMAEIMQVVIMRKRVETYYCQKRPISVLKSWAGECVRVAQVCVAACEEGGQNSCVRVCVWVCPVPRNCIRETIFFILGKQILLLAVTWVGQMRVCVAWF